MADSGIELVRAMYEGWAAGMAFGEFLDRYVDPEVEWHTPASAPEPGPHIGRAAVEAAFGGYVESFDVFRPEAEEIHATGREGEYLVLATTHVRGKGSGAEASARVAHLIQLRNSRVLRMEVIRDRAEALRRTGLAAT